MRLLPFSLSLLYLLTVASAAPVPEANKVARYDVFEPRGIEKSNGNEWKRAASPHNEDTVWARDIAAPIPASWKSSNSD